VPTVDVDGIETSYEISGSGPALLMFSPGGFNATMDNWTTHGIYRRTRMLEQLRERYTCITFDKRESGDSGGRVERITWRQYAEQGKGLLDHIGLERAVLMGGCVGCSIAAAFAVAFPERAAGLVLYSPAGGPRYRMKQHARMAQHAVYVDEHDLGAVVELARGTTAGFSDDARVGPWAPVLRADEKFAVAYAALGRARYQAVLAGLGRTLFDRDTVPGAEPEDLLVLDVPTLVVPGQDTSHATSAARYLEECIPGAEYWDVPVAEQTESTAPARVLEFIDSLALPAAHLA
jgi:pimeloyl-ACP methyl ester carboxylesterase